MKDVQPASDDEVVKLAQRMNLSMTTGKNWAGGPLFPVDLEHGHGPSLWYQLFRKSDKDNYGVFSFQMLVQAVREELLIDECEWPVQRLRAVWASLIADCSTGLLPAGKFGVWMRSGEPVPPRLTNLERRRLMAVKARKQLDDKTAWLIEYERLAATKNIRRYDQETAAIQREISHLSQLVGAPSPAARPQSARRAGPRSDEDLQGGVDRPEALQPHKPDTPWMYRPVTARPQGRGKGDCNWEAQERLPAGADLSRTL